MTPKNALAKYPSCAVFVVCVLRALAPKPNVVVPIRRRIIAVPIRHEHPRIGRIAPVAAENGG